MGRNRTHGGNNGRRERARPAQAADRSPAREGTSTHPAAAETSARKKSCFVICPIGESGSLRRRRTDQLLKYIISPVADSLGYTVDRSDRLAEPGLITSQIIQHVLEDDLVIADLTERNANVFYELAIRHMIRKPLVQMIGDHETLPFDVANMRPIRFDYRDLDSVELARCDLRRQIERVSANLQIETPISVAIDVRELQSSEDPQKRLVADLLGALANIQSELLEIRKRLPAHTVAPAAAFAIAASPSQEHGYPNVCAPGAIAEVHSAPPEPRS